MNPTLSMLLGRKMWLIPGIVVWGDMAGFEPELIITATDGASKRIMHGKFSIGGNSQTLRFGDLLDQRSNKMPAEITNAVVIPISRGSGGAVVQGYAPSDSFRLAKAVPSDAVSIVDLLVIELG